MRGRRSLQSQRSGTLSHSGAPLYQRAVEGFGEQGLVEMIATIGYYTMVAMTLNAFEVQAPGDTQPFAR